MTAAGQADRLPSRRFASNEPKTGKPETANGGAWLRAGWRWRVVLTLASARSLCPRQRMRWSRPPPPTSALRDRADTFWSDARRTSTIRREVVSEISVVVTCVPWLEPCCRPPHACSGNCFRSALPRPLTALNIPVVHVPCTRLDQSYALRQLARSATVQRAPTSCDDTRVYRTRTPAASSYQPARACVALRARCSHHPQAAMPLFTHPARNSRARQRRARS